MVVNFYRNKSENIRADKELTHVIDESIIFKDDVNILRPYAILSRKINTNYAYIPDFGRYYFVTTTNLTGGRFRYDFKVDTVKTYASQIRNIICTVLRNEKLSNAYLYDTEYKTLAYKRYVTKTFPRGLTEDCILLNCVNSGGDE